MSLRGHFLQIVVLSTARGSAVRLSQGRAVRRQDVRGENRVSPGPANGGVLLGIREHVRDLLSQVPVAVPGLGKPVRRPGR